MQKLQIISIILLCFLVLYGCSTNEAVTTMFSQFEETIASFLETTIGVTIPPTIEWPIITTSPIFPSTATPPTTQQKESYPKFYASEAGVITIYKEWYKNAWCYAAHIQLTDYTKFGTICANGKYGSGYETTSHAAKRIGAIFMVNGCYSAPNLDYTTVRSGIICNGSGRESFWCPAIYSSYNGLLLSAWDTQGTPGIAGGQIDELVANHLVTDTFCFGPPNLVNGVVLGANSGARAQRTFIGTNGQPGDLWIVVSDGRYNDGESAGLTGYEGAEYLQSKGCVFGVHLDGGGSSTMYFNGEVLNAARGNQRAVVDFVYFLG